MKISADFPGGNCRVIDVKKSNGVTIVRLEQELRDTPRWWFYWFFKVEDAIPGEVIFCFNNGDVVSPCGPVTGTDGMNWEWCENSRIDAKSFKYTFLNEEKIRYFSFSLPYVSSDFERFYNVIKNDSAVKRSILTHSEQNIAIPIITFGNGEKDIFITARLHCCESTASFALEGIVLSLLNKHRDMLSEFRFHILPFADIDGVENGDQGKDRFPHDHNRDYIDNPIYEFTRALMLYSQNTNPICFLDLHSPWCWGGGNDEPHIHLAPYITPNPNIQNKFAEILSEISNAHEFESIRYNNVKVEYSADKNCSAKYYFKAVLKAPLSITIETPYSGNLNTPYTPELLKLWGEDIANALSKCF